MTVLERIIMKTLISVLQYIVGGIFALGVGAVIIAIGTMVGIWWLSILLYEIGLWPLGALARIVVGFMVIGLGIYMLVGVIVAIGGLISVIRNAANSATE
jgi:hypothetical protein